MALHFLFLYKALFLIFVPALIASYTYAILLGEFLMKKYVDPMGQKKNESLFLLLAIALSFCT